ncbi:MAG: lysostaphin resistance A-like protein [Omnitrophica WOR_2 bacterium]
MKETLQRRHPGFSALLEVGVMFLPAIPAYLWVWPNLSGLYLDIFQCIVYVYILLGTLFIGLRRWSWDQLGINLKGFWFSLACGAVLLTGRLIIILSIDWAVQPPPVTGLTLLGNILFYVGMVGLVEELLFRGLVFRLLEDWLGIRWAIWGSSFGFLLWHVFGQGLLIGAATLLIGLVFAVIRWRAGGIIGLILIHGLWDLESVLLVASSNAEVLSGGTPVIAHPALVLFCFACMVALPFYLWLLHPHLVKLNPLSKSV